MLPQPDIKVIRRMGVVLSQLLVALLVITSCLVASARLQPEPTKVLATVGKKVITYQEFADRYEDYLIYTGLHDNVEARFAILNNMINEIVLRDHDDNAAVYSNPEYKKEIVAARKRTVLAFLKDREVYAKITVSENELREAYRRSKVRLAVRHLYAPTERQAEELYQLAKMGVGFHELAKEAFTDSTLRRNGGYLGYIGWGDTDPNFEKVAYSLKIGEISRPVKTSHGYSIIRVEDRINDPFATEYEFENERTKLERAVRIDKKAPAEEAYLERVFDRRRVRFHERGLDQVFHDLKSLHSPKAELRDHPFGDDAPCIEYDGSNYNAADVVRLILETPGYDRAMLNSVKDVKAAVLGLLMQNVLLKIAHQKGYDTASDVKEEFQKISNDIYLTYKRNEVLSTISVPDSEVARYYSAHAALYMRDREMNVQEIIVGSDSVAGFVRERLIADDDFGVLAQRYSLRAWSAQNKGIIGLAPYSRFGNLKDTLWNAPLGTVVGPIRFDRYWGIFKVLERNDGSPIPMNLVRDQIVNAIRNEKGFPYMKKHLLELRSKTNITVDEQSIRDFSMAPGAQ